MRPAAARRLLALLGTSTAAGVLLRASRRTADVAERPADIPPPAVVVDGTPGKPGDAERRDGGLFRTILSDYKTLASLAGVLIYGVVRVAYDAFYTRLGVFPEAVGLSETAILGRAALYLAITVSIVVMVGALWLLVVAAALRRGTATDAQVAGARRRPLMGSLVLTALCGALFAAGEQLRSLLGSQRLVYYCLERCKLNVLNESILAASRARVQQAKHPGPGELARDFSVTVIGHAWLVVLPLVVLLLGAALGLAWARRSSTEARPVRARILFALFAVGSFTAGLAAPLVVKLTAAAASEAAKSKDAPFLDVHAELARWLLIALPLFAVALGLLAALSLVVGLQPWRSPWVYASFVAVVPLLLGLFEPQIPLYIEEQGIGPVAAAALLIAALVALCFRLSPDRRERAGRWSSPSLAVVVAAIVWSTLFLAWERGLNLGNQAAQGDQIFPLRFSLLSVRSSVVCLRPTQAGARQLRTPYVYLGQVGSTLVLYDYLRDINVDIPESFPVRMPASDVDLRLAELRAGLGWSCRGGG